MPDFKNYNGENIEASLQATTTSDGLLSAADKVKLDSITAGANNYTHPATHPPSIIVQDANNRFVTDAEKSTWNSKASATVVTTTTNGLMIAADKVKLNGVATGANNYVHPANHPASIITQNASNRFVSDIEKTKWNNGSYEYGTNSNGYYKKYGDGTLEMWGIVDISIVISNNNTAPYYSNPATINFPITSTISCSCTAEISSAGAVWLSFVNSVDFTSSISYRLFGGAVYNPLNGKVQWTAKGRWK